MVTPPNLEQSWRAAATLLAHHRDVLDGRPAAGAVPAELEARGWASYLLARDEAAVDGLEAGGADVDWPAGAPRSLLDFVEAVRELTRLPVHASDATIESRPARRSEKPRKQAQIDAFAGVVVPIAKAAERIVDVGSGHGHLTRELADRLGRPVLGLERDEALANRARALAFEEGAAASFAVSDVLSSGLALSARDCVVGLHACGELGDAMVEASARAGASIALVGCCLQKRRASSRAPLVPDGLSVDERRALTLPKSILGLSNLAARNEGVEASRAENLRARQRRVALYRLLGDAGVDLELGAEIEGLNRRAAHATLDVLVTRAFARRSLPTPSATAIDAAARWAAVHHARMRRLALPRSLLARVLEVFVALDRARYLESCGYVSTVEIVFPSQVSARNVALTAHPP